MFSKISRYYNQSDVVTIDAWGRRTASKAFRLLPGRKGSFNHTLEDVDRLDHLAHKYYKQSRDWWHILDANPEFESPHALLGKESMSTYTVPVTWEGEDPLWGHLLQTLHALPGVLEVHMGTAARTYAVQEVVQGPQAAVLPAGVVGQLDQTVRIQELDPLLATSLAAEGFIFPGEIRAEKPDVITWRIRAMDLSTVLTFLFFVDDNAVFLFESSLQYQWVMSAVVNDELMTSQTLQDEIVAAGFIAGQPERVGRIGKPVVIPPRKI